MGPWRDGVEIPHSHVFTGFSHSLETVFFSVNGFLTFFKSLFLHTLFLFAFSHSLSASPTQPAACVLMSSPPPPDAEVKEVEDAPAPTAAELDAQAQAVRRELAAVRAQLTALRAREAALDARAAALERAARAADARARTAGIDFASAGAFPWDERVTAVARTVLGITEFRAHQREAINCLLAGHDCFVVMPTGGGKSLCYVVPALAAVRGATLAVVVSPLLALMQDQADLFAARGIRVARFHSALAPDEAAAVLHSLTVGVDQQGNGNDGDGVHEQGQVQGQEMPPQLLYVTPEMLMGSRRLQVALQTAARAGRIALFAVDEAHCCSEWGHDFRADYARLGVVRALFPGVPIAALTATAPPRVVDDVCDILGTTGCPVFRASFNRPNIRYVLARKAARPRDALAQLQQLVASHLSSVNGSRGSAIVYCLSRRDAETVADALTSGGTPAVAYHSGLDAATREAAQRRWARGDVPVVVGTVAFGLGISKPDVRLVVHYTVPKSLDAFYQESGRAGRDGRAATSVVLFAPRDVPRVAALVCSTRGGLRALDGALAYCLNHTRCRRCVLADHWHEHLDLPAACAGHCDVCAPVEGCGAQRWVARDVQALVRAAAAVLGGAVQHMTYIMLDDALHACPDRHTLFDPAWSRDDRLEIYVCLSLSPISFCVCSFASLFTCVWVGKTTDAAETDGRAEGGARGQCVHGPDVRRVRAKDACPGRPRSRYRPGPKARRVCTPASTQKASTHGCCSHGCCTRLRLVTFRARGAAPQARVPVPFRLQSQHQRQQQRGRRTEAVRRQQGGARGARADGGGGRRRGRR